ncbi:MAG: hypothetical protein ACR2NL_11195, partial [Acidimicrobiia bacterium]
PIPDLWEMADSVLGALNELKLALGLEEAKRARLLITEEAITARQRRAAKGAGKSPRSKAPSRKRSKKSASARATTGTKSKAKTSTKTKAKKPSAKKATAKKRSASKRATQAKN